MKFLTISGSVYELSDDRKLFRRVEGVNPIHPWLVEDGVWHPIDEDGMPYEPNLRHHFVVSLYGKSIITNRIAEFL
jgi:hypothetical protein